MLCVLIFTNKRRDLQFKVDPERQIFENLFMTILFTLRVFARNLLRGNRRKNTFRIFVLMCGPLEGSGCQLESSMRNPSPFRFLHFWSNLFQDIQR